LLATRHYVQCLVLLLLLLQLARMLKRPFISWVSQRLY
jgi:hypothetical protein